MQDRRAFVGLRSPRGLAVAFAALTLISVGIVSRYALGSIVLDGLAAVIVVVPPILAGTWLVSVLPVGPMPRRWHLLLGAGLGLGGTALLILLLGWGGILHRAVWAVILVIFTAAGVVQLRTLYTRNSDAISRRALPGRRGSGPFRGLWLIAWPFLVLALLAASNACGFIWQEEGYGYDVLEYHLQMPKEYLAAGRLTYAPHNVYANFPANVEMLYLLAMILLDDDAGAGVVANLVHLLLAGLAVFAAWVAGREWSSRAGTIAGVVTASAGWLAYLSGLAYVENGMLFFGLVALAAILRSLSPPRAAASTGGAAKSPSPNPLSVAPRGLKPAAQPGFEKGPKPGRWIALAGVMAGFACGCKYTAVAMIALPLGVVVLLLPAANIRRRLRNGLAFAGAATLTFAPWLIKNQILTGNPVFPLANRMFHASPPGWGEEESSRWDRGHRPPAEQFLEAKLAALWRHVLADRYQRFGPAVFLLAIGGLVGRRRTRADQVLLIVLVAQLGVWLFATHLYARFAVVMLVPLALLAGRALPDSSSGLRRRVVVTLLIAGGVWNLGFAATLHAEESPGGAPAALMYEGAVPGYEYFGLVNNKLPDNARILLVGDARPFYFQRDVDYCVVFNRNPFVETIRAAGSDREIVDWLRARGYTHVLVNWSEVRRLSRTYGFAPEITPELFDRLSRYGLTLSSDVQPSRDRGRYVELYNVTAD